MRNYILRGWTALHVMPTVMASPLERMPCLGARLIYQINTQPIGISRRSHLRLPSYRYVSTNTARPIRLEKPIKFVPPSHGKRLKQQIPRHYGPELTQTQKTEQATKQYPHMMPPPGTFMFWFLTNRTIHVFITLVSPSPYEYD